MKQNIEYIIRHISDILVINGGFLGNPGLYSGEMGFVLFFTKYARYTKNDLYLDYVYDLIEKLQSRIHKNTLINYTHGLTGIGSAIEYLVQNGFFEADTDDILEDFDNRIFFKYNLSYLSIEEINDIGYYTAWRMSGTSCKKDFMRQKIIPQIEKNTYNNFVHLAALQFNKQIKSDFLKERSYNCCLEHIAKTEFWHKDMGLQNGLAGWGMSLLTELDGDNSWLLLLPDELNITKDESIPV